MNSNAIIFDEPPDNFSPGAFVSACHLMIDREILLIQRSPTNSEPGKWGVPAGKIENNDTTEEAIKRELFEETGLSFPHHLSKK